ncbi:recombinase family protein [Rhizobiaceae bacterium n13]|nr:recombinase family protein [Fererhizobium litorale]MDI7864587.1 recombinase family protein [Fererhizobium litorale]
MTRPKAFSYVRMSTDIQLKGDSLRRQRELSKQYAEANELDLVEDFRLEDIGVSAFGGRNVAYGALGRFIDAITSGVVPRGSYLLVESLDRLSREKPQVATGLFLNILNAGVNIVTLADARVFLADSDDLSDLLVSVVVLSRAYEESLTKSKRVGAAWQNKRNNIGSRKLTEIAPAWLRLLPGRGAFEAIDDRVELLRRIFHEADLGRGSYQIARRLNLEGVLPFTPSNGWHESYITKILTNRAV